MADDLVVFDNLQEAYLAMLAQLAAMTERLDAQRAMLSSTTAERDNAREDRNRFVLALNSARAFHDKERLRADAMTAESKQKDDMMAALNSEAHIAKERLAAMTAARDDLLYQQTRSKTCIERLNAQLTASEADGERLAQIVIEKANALRDQVQHWEQMYRTELAHSENLAKSTAAALARTDALVTLVEEINGEAQSADIGEDTESQQALRRIRALAEKGLRK